MNTQQLLEKRAGLVRQMRDAQDAADASANGSMTPEQATAFDALKSALAALENALANRSLIEAAERRMAGSPIGGTGDRTLDGMIGDFSITRAIAFASGLQVDAGREREVSAELARRSGRKFEGIAVPLAALRRPVEQRVISTSTPSGGPGSALIQTTVDGSQYIDLLRTALVIRQLGARVLMGLTANLNLPRLKGAAPAGWVAEGSPLTASDEQFDSVPLRPKHAGALVELSRNMLLQTSPDIEQLVRADLAQVLARVLDGAAITGTGAANDPTGILATAGIGSVAIGTNGGALTYGAVVDLWGAVADANAIGENAAFLGNTRVKRAVAKMTTTIGAPLGADVVFQSENTGFTNLVPSNLTKGTGTGLSALIYGNWSDLVMGLWSELDILVNPYAAGPYAAGNVQVRAMMTCDIAVRHPQSFAAITDIVA